MDEHEWLAERFEEHRTHLKAVAYRMLGSLAEADDAVQDAYLRLSRSGANGVENLGGWLTTIVARVCLNMLRSRNLVREEPMGGHVPDPVISFEDGVDPEHEVLLADSVGLALQVVLDTLAPAGRLASRARRRVRGLARVPDAELVLSGEWSTPSLPRRAAATSTPCSLCLTPTWCCVLIADRPAPQRPG